jgi:hypothetical protein
MPTTTDFWNESRVRFGRESLYERGGEPGFADPGLTG